MIIQFTAFYESHSSVVRAPALRAPAYISISIQPPAATPLLTNPTNNQKAFKIEAKPPSEHCPPPHTQQPATSSPGSLLGVNHCGEVTCSDTAPQIRRNMFQTEDRVWPLLGHSPATAPGIHQRLNEYYTQTIFNERCFFFFFVVVLFFCFSFVLIQDWKSVFHAQVCHSSLCTLSKSCHTSLPLVPAWQQKSNVPVPGSVCEIGKFFRGTSCSGRGDIQHLTQ